MRALARSALLLALFACAAPNPAAPPSAATGRDYLVVASRPNLVHLLDLEAQRVVRSCPLPAAGAPATLVLSPDHQIAYALAGLADVYGVSLETCEVVFSTAQSQGNERVRTLGSLAISPDGRQIYTHQNPTLLFTDHYEVQDTRLAIFDTSAGIGARPVRTLPAPRQVTILGTGADGTLYLGGPDFYAMDVASGKTRVALASRSRVEPGFGPRDVLSVWNIGDASGELIRLFSAPRWKEGAPGDLAQATSVWGYERIVLATGQAETHVAGPLEVTLFSGMTRPGHPDQLYAVLTQLQRFDVPNQRIAASVDLEHSYYTLTFGSDGRRLYLAGTFNDVAIYDADTLTRTGKIVLPGGDMVLTGPKLFRR
jgi:quinohemoprotein amine dehydrogenase beta subunit